MDERTAYKLFIKDIVERPLIKVEGERSHIEINGLLVHTVRAMGVVVSRYEAEKFIIITLDDSTETISIRAFGEEKDLLGGVKIGDLIDVAGGLREYEEEVYITPYWVRKVDDPNWELVRTLELLLRKKMKGKVKEEIVSDAKEAPESDLKPFILGLIEEIDEGEGADYNTLLKRSELEDSQLEQTLNDLLSTSEVYEPKIGRFKRV